MTFARRTHDLNTGNSLTEEKIENEFDAIYNVFNGTTDVEVELKGGLTIEAQSGFSAYATTTQSIAKNVYIIIHFDTEEYDTLGEFDNSTGIFTATQAGTYQVNWMTASDVVTWAQNQYWIADVRKNNSMSDGYMCRGMFEFMRVAGGVSGRMMSRGSHIFKLAATDTLRIVVIHNNAAATVNCSASGTYNTFTVQKIA